MYDLVLDSGAKPSVTEAKVKVEGVIFDYGRVLCLPQQPADIEGMAGICGVPVPRFQDLYWKFRISYDRAELTGESYWHMVARENEGEFSREQVEQLMDLDAMSWSRRNDATLAWVEQLRAAKLRLGVLSNMPLPIGNHLRTHCDWFANFDNLTFSCDVGQVKPAPAIYEICLKKLGLRAEDALFLDDIAVNVEGAARMGIHSVIFETAERTIPSVAQRFHLPAPF